MCVSTSRERTQGNAELWIIGRDIEERKLGDRGQKLRKEVRAIDMRRDRNRTHQKSVPLATMERTAYEEKDSTCKHLKQQQ